MEAPEQPHTEKLAGRSKYKCGHRPDGHLRAEQPLSLEVELGVGLPGAVAADPRLHGAHQLVDLVVTDLLHQTQHAGPELIQSNQIIVTDEVKLNSQSEQTGPFPSPKSRSNDLINTVCFVLQEKSWYKVG